MTLGYTQEIGALTRAIFNVQSKLEPLMRTSEAQVPTKTGSYTFKYADLTAVREAIMPLCIEEGLLVVQAPLSNERGVGVETSVIHVESGERMISELILPYQGQDPRAAGGCITYACRYALAAIFGVKQEDDDAEAAQADSVGQQQRPAPAKQPAPRGGSPTANPAPAPSTGKLETVPFVPGMGGYKNIPPWWNWSVSKQGKFASKTWGWMTQGDLDGDRYRFLNWASEKFDGRLRDRVVEILDRFYGSAANAQASEEQEWPEESPF